MYFGETTSRRRLFQDLVTLEHFLDFLKSSSNLFFGVSSHEAESNESVVGSDSRRNHRIDKHALFEEVASYGESLVVVANVKRNNRS